MSYFSFTSALCQYFPLCLISGSYLRKSQHTFLFYSTFFPILVLSKIVLVEIGQVLCLERLDNMVYNTMQEEDLIFLHNTYWHTHCANSKMTILTSE